MSSKKAAAGWLRSVVGVDGVFTKQQLRDAFPGVAQIDRRVRDLRTEGWVILTRREDPRLDRDQMRLVQIPTDTDPGRKEAAVSPRMRRATFLESAFTCVCCGVAGGEPYPDARHVLAALTILEVESGVLTSVCLRCRETASSLDFGSPELSEVAATAVDLENQDWLAVCRERLRRRISGRQAK
jgi:hypothetical protein